MGFLSWFSFWRRPRISIANSLVISALFAMFLALLLNSNPMPVIALTSAVTIAALTKTTWDAARQVHRWITMR